MAAQWPRVAARLVALLPTLPHWAGVTVLNGAAYDVSTATWATVGHASDGMTTTAGSYRTTQAPDGYRYLEQGAVACEITCTDDGPDITAIRALMFSLLDDLEAVIRADRTLGVLSSEGTVDLTVDVGSFQSIPGAASTVVFSVEYLTVT